MTVAAARHILECAGLRLCPHSEITTYCGCDPERCDDIAARLRAFMERGGWPDGEQQTAWAESMVGMGYLTFLGTIDGIPRVPDRWYRLTTKGRELVGPVRSYG